MSLIVQEVIYPNRAVNNANFIKLYCNHKTYQLAEIND